MRKKVNPVTIQQSIPHSIVLRSCVDNLVFLKFQIATCTIDSIHQDTFEVSCKDPTKVFQGDSIITCYTFIVSPDLNWNTRPNCKEKITDPRIVAG